MSEKHRVPVFDPESGDLRKLPLKKLEKSKFEKIDVPNWRRQVDVYESHDEKKSRSYAIVTGPTDDTEGKVFLARLYMSRLGVASDVQRLLSSKHRTLYIGSLPSA
ncbi:hypothetical protein MMC28_007291 [Mycoblastus sanguinarius]|nr:hypothetical protein [Mycoblastus sanguinarius]